TVTLRRQRLERVLPNVLARRRLCPEGEKNFVPSASLCASLWLVDRRKAGGADAEAVGGGVGPVDVDQVVEVEPRALAGSRTRGKVAQRFPAHEMQVKKVAIGVAIVC